MKPTSQTSPDQQPSRNFPLTDYSFQTTAEAPVSSVAVLTEARARAFRKLSSQYFAAETHIDYVAELFFFVLIAGIAAWSIISMLACLAWMKIVF